MRISDWSSDVCSSDLELERGFGAPVRFAFEVRVAELEALRRDVRAVRHQLFGRRRAHRARHRRAELAAFEDVIGRTDRAREAVEITFEPERLLATLGLHLAPRAFPPDRPNRI